MKKALTFTTRTKEYFITHKIISGIIIVVVIGAGYGIYKKVHGATTQTLYTLGTVEKGTLISSITASGQVASSNQVDIKPKVSGDIIFVGVKAGDTVKAGTVIARVDAAEAQKAFRDAQANVVSAQISYQKTLLQSKGTVQSSQQSLQNAQTDLDKAYQDGFSEVSNTMLDFPALISSVTEILYNQAKSPYMSDTQLRAIGEQTAVSNKYKAGTEFDSAKAQYQALVATYTKLSPTSPEPELEALITNAYNMSKTMADALKDLHITIDYVKSRTTTPSNAMASDLSTVDSYVTKINSHASSLLASTRTIENAKQSITNAQQSLAEQTVTINGSDTLDVQTAKLTLTQRQNAVTDARNTLADYTITAPFDGVIATIAAVKGDSASSATSLATLITQQKIATISLNEVDAAHIKVGQKATLTFDALPDLSISGQVIEVDPLGATTQGVVSYTVKVGLDTQDETIKPGMSVSAALITDSKVDVLLVPSSAVKTSGTTSTVQVVENPPAQVSSQAVTLPTAPKSVPVQIGASNDTETEIISGLQAGETIVTKTTTTSTKTTSTQTSSATSLLGGTRTGGAPFR